MPFGYGGGITTKEDALRLVTGGVEKIILGDPSILSPNLITEISEVIGAQSTAVVLNHKRDFLHRRNCYVKNGSKKIKTNIKSLVKQSIGLGAGEIIFYDIDCDGMRDGYDLPFISEMSRELSVPSLFVGGAGSVSHFDKALQVYKDAGLGAGSFFTLFGKYRTPLISYEKPTI